ncbi:DegT/DnrJ/EryC1/StrS aminotransferase [Shewanella denitrificans OS217]|uniref:DegT/DnrJ/EryC1/StrS aminotransferase n=1 Tax=Shewanella denitrificans (strain OS217 / ATCC BAA-1090 / DSM 15013) TaxID=318161 RepID=Q12PQ3_SHEDO|nr:UDP-4-amino-4,6-dideoxy-N-acetyl-beta-L-altrosamine transaminase [Shewanella denitrificans]ABE54573.1 DegT/DnrJ/EryC1/StrS aminotransferase [Shewanella denitrificans OS217]
MIPYGKQHISQQDIDLVVQVLKSDYLTQGPKVPEFERVLCSYTDAKYSVVFNSATSALHIACLALNVGPGDLVWTSPITFVASANCALYAGADIDFVDVDFATGNMSVDALATKLIKAKEAGRLPKVIIPVHLAGHSCDMAAIHALASQYSIKIIEDASHGIGGHFGSKKIGACQYSDICIFSFHPVKIVTSAEGGAAMTNSHEIAEKMRLLRSHGIVKDTQHLLRPDEGDWYYEQQDLGFNYRMTELSAALGISQMSNIDAFVAKRNELASDYCSQLADLPLMTVTPIENSHSAYHLQIVLFDKDIDRKQVFNSMRAANIMVHVHYFPVHLQPYYLSLGFKEHDFPQAEAYYRQCLTLPLFPDLTSEQQRFVIDELKRCL